MAPAQVAPGMPEIAQKILHPAKYGSLPGAGGPARGSALRILDLADLRRIAIAAAGS